MFKCLPELQKLLNVRNLIFHLKIIFNKDENVDYDQKGLEAILFTAQGDMRQALNNLQGNSKPIPIASN